MDSHGPTARSRSIYDIKVNKLLYFFINSSFFCCCCSSVWWNVSISIAFQHVDHVFPLIFFSVFKSRKKKKEKKHILFHSSLSSFLSSRFLRFVWHVLICVWLVVSLLCAICSSGGRPEHIANVLSCLSFFGVVHSIVVHVCVCVFTFRY